MAEKKKPTSGPTIPSFGDFQAQQSGGAATATGGTSRTGSKVTETISSPSVGGGFSLGDAQSGLRSPDAIDQPDNYLTITNTVGVQSLPPEEMADLQAALKQAGLTPDGFQTSGVLDGDTQKALLELKRNAQASGMSDMDTLRTRIATAAASAAGGGSQYAPTRSITEPVFTDPLTARGVLRDAMTARLGRAPTSDEYHQFRTMLSNSEAGQDVSDSRTHVNKNGVVVTKTTHSDDTTDPSAADIADDYLSRGDLGREANTVQAANYYDVIARRIGG